MAPGGSQRGQTLRSLPRLSGLGLFMSIVLFACGARRAHALSWPSSQRPAPLSLRSPGDSPHRPGSVRPAVCFAATTSADLRGREQEQRAARERRLPRSAANPRRQRGRLHPVPMTTDE
eukprot:3481306-Rhodomonas_salina.1